MRRRSVFGQGVLGQSGGATIKAAPNVDDVRVTLFLIPSSTDIYTDTATHDSATLIVSLVPSGTEARESTDANTAQVTLTPKTTQEGLGHTDANTAIILLTPDAYEEKIAGVATAYPVPTHTEGYATFLFGKIVREQKHLRGTKRPTLPIYDRTNFPQDAITGQVAIASDGSLWTYNDTWNLVAGP